MSRPRAAAVAAAGRPNGHRSPLAFRGAFGIRAAQSAQQLAKRIRIHQISYVIFSTDVTTVSPKFLVVIPKRVREQFGLSPGQTLQVIALPGRIKLVPTQSPGELRGFLQGINSFQREGNRLCPSSGRWWIPRAGSITNCLRFNGQL